MSLVAVVFAACFAWSLRSGKALNALVLGESEAALLGIDPERLILDDIDVHFRSGRFSVVLGPNSAGKSTPLRLATGLARPTTGAVLYEERPVRSYDASTLARWRAVLS